MSKYEPVLVDGPDVLPVTLDECKRHLRVIGNDEDSTITLFLEAVVDHLDGATGWLGRSITAQTWSQQFDRFEWSLLLDLAPVSEISSVTYLDGDEVAQTVTPADYALLNATSAPEVRFLSDFAFPGVTTDRPAVTITFVSGYGQADEVPAAIKAGILLMVADLYQNREAKLDTGFVENSSAARLLNPYRTRWVA